MRSADAAVAAASAAASSGDDNSSSSSSSSSSITQSSTAHFDHACDHLQQQLQQRMAALQQMANELGIADTDGHFAPFGNSSQRAGQDK
eukprot:6272-Heterococcus_DN1.PRE.2